MDEVRIGRSPAATMVARTTATRACRSAAIWGVLFGVLIINEARSYHTSFPTATSRQDFARSFGGQSGLAALLGPGRDLDTVNGFVAWRLLVLLIWIGAIWGIVTATRLIRREEDAGRWELLLAGRTSRRHATGQAIAGLMAGWAVLWATVAVSSVIAGSQANVGFSTSASLFYATAATASAAVALALGALMCQLAPTRRQANVLGTVALTAAYLIRMVADSAAGFRWLLWASPLGWIENLHPLTGSQPVALLPIVAFVVAAFASSIALAGRRDVGSAVLARPPRAALSTRLVGGANVLVVQLERWIALAWIGGLGVLAAVFAITARVAASGNIALTNDRDQLGRLGGSASGVRTWIGYEFTYLAAALALAAIGQIAALRNEEADGHLDNLLAGPVRRVTWLAGRIGFGAVMVVAAGMALGIGGWLGVGIHRADVTLADMLRAGFNATLPALFILGVGTALYSILPRVTMPVLYAVLMWSFLVDIIGSTITTNRWLLDTALFVHFGPVPATALAWRAIGAVAGLSLLGGLVGLARIDQRDLEPA